MITFREFHQERLDEVARHLERALKLGSYLAKRSTAKSGWRNKPHAIYLKGYDYDKTDELEAHTDKHIDSMKKQPFGHDHPIEDIEVHKLHPTQATTTFKADYARDVKSKDDKPIKVIHHKGKHYIMDGHHRWMQHKLEGKKTIKAQVLHV